MPCINIVHVVSCHFDCLRAAYFVGSIIKAKICTYPETDSNHFSHVQLLRQAFGNHCHFLDV